ncbi:transposase for insertion sequence element D domain protein (plasmid) [Bacillus cereus E33L]|nr:transposase for insertion sequence element D domain protein [Bacillus cereus E33L]
MSELKCAYMVQIYLKKYTPYFFVFSNILFQCSVGSFKISVKMGEKHGGIKKNTV